MPHIRCFGSGPELGYVLELPGGCPAAFFRGIAVILEESYEVLQAIDVSDMYNLREELGDLLLQVVFHAQIAEEEGEFTLEDVIDSLNEKMVRRHPQVFGDAEGAEVGWDGFGLRKSLTKFRERFAEDSGNNRFYAIKFENIAVEVLDRVWNVIKLRKS